MTFVTSLSPVPSLSYRRNASQIETFSMAQESKKPNIIVRAFRGLWGGFNFVRRLVFGVIALILLAGMLAGLSAGVLKLKDKTVLVIAPRGAIVEQYSTDLTDRAMAEAFGEEAMETQLRDVLRALKAAAKDPKIDRVLLMPDQITSMGLATAREIGLAIDALRQSGKEVIAYGDSYGQRAYYLAAHADTVYMHPEGGVLLEGLGRYRTYFKDAFDKFGIDVRLFRVGEYKSAGEPFIRSDQSPEAREADLYWMGDLWQRFLADIAAKRELDVAKLAAMPDTIVEDIRAVQGDLGQLAVKQGLVDQLITPDQLRKVLIDKGAEDEDEKTFRQVALADYLAHLDRTQPQLPLGQRIGVVVAEGEILDGKQPGGTIGGDSTSALLRRAREDDTIKAVVLRVDSPGGGVFPSELIRREVELTRAAGKPVIVSMGDVAASGGYWISMNADRIFASPDTITGSIGIFGLWANFPTAMSKLGLRTDGVATSWIVGAFDPTRPYDPRLGEVIQTVIDRGYREFIGKVGSARGQSPEQIDVHARGRVWSGAQALERGLVDELGSLNDAIAAAAKAADLGDDYQLTYVEKELSPFEQALQSSFGAGIGAVIARIGFDLPARWLPDPVVDDVMRAEQLVRDAAARRPVAIYAHCNCEIK